MQSKKGFQSVKGRRQGYVREGKDYSWTIYYISWLKYKADVFNWGWS